MHRRLRSFAPLGLAAIGALLALIAPAPAAASTPVPWCGTDAVSGDRRPDETNGFSFHVVYAFPADGGDRFGEWAPRIVGDIAAIEAWWPAQDATRAPRFDLHGFPCGSSAGRLDLSRVQLSRPASAYATQETAYQSIVGDLTGPPSGFADPDKLYLVYYDGPVGVGRTCGTGSRGRPGLVFVQSCGQEGDHGFRSIAAVHELMHVLGAVPPGAPHGCETNGGHVCDTSANLMFPTGGFGQTLLGTLLDAGRDDYYGHTGPWSDAQDSLFLERLDGADRAAPAPPAELVVRTDGNATAMLTWRASTDDVGPVGYRLYRDGGLLRGDLRQATGYDAVLPAGQTSEYAVRAVDAVGHLSRPTSVRFKAGLGLVDAEGRLLRDTVSPGRIAGVRLMRRQESLVLRWNGIADAGGCAATRC